MTGTLNAVGAAQHSGRSQRSLRQEHALLAEDGRLAKAVAIEEQKIERAEADKIVLSKRIAEAIGDPKLSNFLNNYEAEFRLAVDDIAHSRELIATHNQRREAIALELIPLRPDEVQLAARTALQERFAALASARLELDRQGALMVSVFAARLSQLIAARQQQTRELEELAELLELPHGGLDPTRFEDLLAALQQDFVSAAQQWHDHILGREEFPPFMVIAERLLVGESLFDNGARGFGEEVCLPEADASALLREGKVLVPATWANAVAEAEQSGLSLSHVGIRLVLLGWEQRAREEAEGNAAPEAAHGPGTAVPEFSQQSNKANRLLQRQQAGL